MVQQRLGSPNYLGDSQFDWSISRHHLLSRYKDFPLKRQFCARPPTKQEGRPRAVSVYTSEDHLFDEQICRLYLRSDEFQLISQQMDVDFLVFELLERLGVDRFRIERPRKHQQEDFSIDYGLVFKVHESFIPHTIQLIFYDKILDRYSIHHYQLQKVSLLRDLLNSVAPETLHSEDFLAREGVDRVLQRYHVEDRVCNPFNRYYIGMSRIVRPLGFLNDFSGHEEKFGEPLRGRDSEEDPNLRSIITRFQKEMIESKFLEQ